jgi:haloalkane dehalogenase
MENPQAELPATGVAQVGSASVRWRTQGIGPSIVFLHGFPLSGRTWDKLIARLRDRFTCHFPDLIGLGESHSTAAEDYSSEGQARALQAMLAQRGVESYALVGNDTGGWIARELALIDRPRITRLVLTNTEIPLHRPPWIPMYQTLARVPGFGRILRQTLKLRGLRRSPLVFGGCFHDLDRIDGEFHHQFVEPLILSNMCTEHALQFLRQMKFTRLDAFSRLHQELKMPTLFIWGADDPTFPEVRARAMLHQFPNVAGFHSIPNAKLFVYEEHPDMVARLIGAFLAGDAAPEAQPIPR